MNSPAPGPTEIRIREKLNQAFEPVYLEVENESHSHSVPKNSETHFRILVVSLKFEGVSRIGRQRMVNELLKSELAPGGVHALTQRLMSVEEWKASGRPEVESPPCYGGSKRES